MVTFLLQVCGGCQDERHVNIFLKFLPPKVVGLLQPMDQGGLIEATKRCYQKNTAREKRSNSKFDVSPLATNKTTLYKSW